MFDLLLPSIAGIVIIIIGIIRIFRKKTKARFKYIFIGLAVLVVPYIIVIGGSVAENLMTYKALIRETYKSENAQFNIVVY